MRVHLPALIALVSTSTYVACGSTDPTKSVQTAGAGGEAGVAGSKGGESSVAGTQSSGGSSSNAGEAGMTTGGLPANAGAGGSEAGAGGQPPSAGAGGQLPSGGAAGDSGAAGAGGSVGDLYPLPAECPGIVGDYTLTIGTDAADQFTHAQQDGQALIYGLAGPDVFDVDYEGQDCLLGGPGDDVFTSSGESSSYFFGGPGDDVYHLINDYNYFYVADMESNDTVPLSKAAFPFLLGASGATAGADQVFSLAGYSSGNASIPASENSGAIVYDPDNGQLWSDTDGGDKTTGAKQIGTIMNYATYTFDITDFQLAD